MRNSTRKTALLWLIVLLIVIALRMLGLLRAATAVVY